MAMANSYFRFKQFTIHQEKAAFKVGTDGVLLGACAHLNNAENILDIGTGTGLIAIMSAQRSRAKITAIEPDEGSFLQALENVKSCMWSDRIHVIHTDLQSFSAETKQIFDSIITNPPYFINSLRNPDEAKSSARHTFSLAHEDILRYGSGLLTDNGNLQVILPYTEGNLFIAEAVSFGLFCNRIIKIRPTPTAVIKRLILLFEKRQKPVTEKFLTIETGVRNRYTEDYKVATSDFYLDSVFAGDN